MPVGEDEQAGTRSAAGGTAALADEALIARGGCASIQQIPAALSRLWDDCHAGELAGY
jgi:hypothetical protein